MLESSEANPKDYNTTPSTKRTNDVLSPQNDLDLKQRKKGDDSVMPLWAKSLPNKEDIQTLLDNGLEKFKRDVFDPLKDQLMGRMDKIENDISKRIPERISKMEDDLKSSLNFNS